MNRHGVHKKSPLNPTETTPGRTAQPLMDLSTNIISGRAQTKTPAKGEAGRTPTGNLSQWRRTRYTPGKIVKPTTPHGIRAFEQRRAGKLTPARHRRRSVKAQRDTPRDLLRQLSRVLPRANPTPEKTATQILAEEGESSEDDLSLESPRLSFGIHEDEKAPRTGRLSIEKGRRAMPDAGRLSMDASLLVGDMADSDDDDEDAPTTKLLDDISDDEISLPTPTFGERDMGDTLALRQMLALTRSPGSPQNDHDPPTPTADMSFALEIPDLPGPQSVSSEDDAPPVGIVGEDDFDLPGANDDELSTDPQGLEVEESVARKAPLGMGTINHPLLDSARTATKKPGQKSGKKRASPRDGLPKGVAKRVAASFLQGADGRKGRLKKGALDAILTASNWFFEQVSEDISAYAEHAGRKTVDESDALMLIRRQKLLSNKSTLFSLAQKYLPGELLKDVKNVQRSGKGA